MSASTADRPRVLAFAGSVRRGSLNRALVRAGAERIRAAGLDCTLLELADHPLPLYDGDLEAEQGLPAAAAALRDMFLDHDALLIAAPEYNSSITPLLKNTLDWVSRSPGGEGDLSPYADKVAGLLAASPGALGGLRGLGTVRSILSSIGVLVLPEQAALARAHQSIDAEGRIVDDAADARVRKVCEALVERTLRLSGGR